MMLKNYCGNLQKNYHLQFPSIPDTKLVCAFMSEDGSDHNTYLGKKNYSLNLSNECPVCEKSTRYYKEYAITFSYKTTSVDVFRGRLNNLTNECNRCFVAAHNDDNPIGLSTADKDIIELLKKITFIDTISQKREKPIVVNPISFEDANSIDANIKTQIASAYDRTHKK